MSREPAIRVHHLTRTFRRSGGVVRALDDVSFEVGRGEVVALLGVNGAGKTTVTKILSTLLLPTAGHASVLGHDVVTEAAAVRASTSVILGGDRGFYDLLTGRENLVYFGTLAGASRRALRAGSSEALDSVGLGEAADRRVETYSKGMRQRLHVAVGLLTDPAVLLLDEPTVGLDPDESERLRRTVARLRERSTTVLLTSHNLLDVERLADRVVMLARGSVTHDLPLQEFAGLAGYTAVVRITVAGSSDRLLAALVGAGLDCVGVGPGAHPTTSVERADGGGTATAHVRVRTWSADVLQRVGAAIDGQQLLDMSVAPTSLEEAFALASAGPTRPVTPGAPAAAQGRP